ncbi:MAG: ABC transporter ATP-binding protein [Limisphaerales bacterium]
MSEPLLLAKALTKSYIIASRTLDVLRGVDLDVARGDFLALRGASGAGKSTLLHLIGGLDSPNSGQILFEGRDVAQFSERELTHFRNRRVGFIFQAYHLLPELTALENVCLPARIARVPSAAAKNRALALLGEVGLGDRIEHKPYELSGGEQQRVAIARSLIAGPELILADEPTGNLDSRTGMEIIELLKNLCVQTNAALIIATHDSKVAAAARRVIELADGRVAAVNVGSMD